MLKKHTHKSAQQFFWTGRSHMHLVTKPLDPLFLLRGKLIDCCEVVHRKSTRCDGSFMGILRWYSACMWPHILWCLYTHEQITVHLHIDVPLHKKGNTFYSASYKVPVENNRFTSTCLSINSGEIFFLLKCLHLQLRCFFFFCSRFGDEGQFSSSHCSLSLKARNLFDDLCLHYDIWTCIVNSDLMSHPRDLLLILHSPFSVPGRRKNLSVPKTRQVESLLRPTRQKIIHFYI